MSQARADDRPAVNKPHQVLFASLIGTTIEFFDFYIYATAAVLVFPQLVLSGVGSGDGNIGVARDVRHRLPGAPDRIRALRPFRRSRGPQDHAGCRPAHHGRVHGRHRRAADLLLHRCPGSAAARHLPFRPGSRSRRRVGRRRAPGDRECAARKTCLVRHVPAARGTNRILLFWRRVSGALPLAHRRAVLRLGLAHSLPGECGVGPRRTLRPSDHHRNPGVPRRPVPTASA